METASSASSGDLMVAARQLATSAPNLSTEIDRDRRLPDQLAEQLKEAGLFLMLLGQEFGGLEANPITATQVVEIISESNASAGWVVMILASTSYWASALLPDAPALQPWWARCLGPQMLPSHPAGSSPRQSQGPISQR